ncbi:MAG: nucleotidyltransferase family protein [Magnetococcales bacterium]|nr:nucleotidyltransferase family protein [Magnetococcales bacterium]MBF0149635.1 nucleotidyltransferase family protein [Magnetococcales bacterium]MBF0172481.1 nucleotidyltransferase family protein [Magnetococcales bacterium]MBF0347567.1 nucleotidyltransferase family protein [Magnetococcales bacterium]MBF0632093.1 nucleotidyltransferase family protein [Magnetococcales bacterium]
MNVFILAAGRGERLRPLTDHHPKPLLAVDGHPVIDHTLERLKRLPIHRIIVNTWHLAEMLEDHLTRHPHWRRQIVISRETELLETGGGIRNALPLLGDGPCLAINGDILWDFDLEPLVARFDPAIMDALLLLVANPAGKKGDFTFLDDTPGPLRRCRAEDPQGWTYSGIQMFTPQTLAGYPIAPFSLNRFFDDALPKKRIHGILLPGTWSDMGTPATLAAAREHWKFPLQIGAN